MIQESSNTNLQFLHNLIHEVCWVPLVCHCCFDGISKALEDRWIKYDMLMPWYGYVIPVLCQLLIIIQVHVQVSRQCIWPGKICSNIRKQVMSNMANEWPAAYRYADLHGYSGLEGCPKKKDTISWHQVSWIHVMVSFTKGYLCNTKRIVWQKGCSFNRGRLLLFCVILRRVGYFASYNALLNIYEVVLAGWKPPGTQARLKYCKANWPLTLRDNHATVKQCTSPS